jgi:integrase
MEMNMKQLNFALKQICKRNKDGSYATQTNRERILTLIANQLYEFGFRNLRATGLKEKHVKALVKMWLSENISVGTIKNRMCHLRWWSEKISKPALLAKNNQKYGIDDRVYVTNVSKAQTLNAECLEKISDPHTKISLMLQQEFGLRREESIKFSPTFADQGDSICLKSSWTKGGLSRVIPVRTATQRQLLDHAHSLVGMGSLIPENKNYIQQLNKFNYETNRVGIRNVHGLRHGYAQRLYKELAGWECPKCGGKTSKQLTSEEKKIDHDVRLIISKELGHKREQITAIYLGR